MLFQIVVHKKYYYVLTLSRPLSLPMMKYYYILSFFYPILSNYFAAPRGIPSPTITSWLSFTLMLSVLSFFLVFILQSFLVIEFQSGFTLCCQGIKMPSLGWRESKYTTEPKCSIRWSDCLKGIRRCSAWARGLQGICRIRGDLEGDLEMMIILSSFRSNIHKVIGPFVIKKRT